MSNFDKDKAIDIVDACLDLPEPARTEYIDRECSGNDALRKHVHGLMKYREDEDEDEDEDENLELVKSYIGKNINKRYVMQKSLGEGGMGVVYLALDKKLNKKVAIKLINQRKVTPDRMRRFDSEQKDLAKMRHSGIASIYDSSYTEDEIPYFVMEYVPGNSITDFCDKHCINIKERIGLFQELCDAMGHAHSKDIIHRDLKPSNVLVFYEDSKPMIKVIDFGIAKALGEEHSDQTAITRPGNPIGTPEYMSPEQAEGKKVDTKTDIYSLGVLLYELLSGQLPFDREQLKNPPGFQRIICGEEPHKPSTKCHSAISSSPDTASKIAQERDTTSKGLPHTLRGDLDWIIMKCLEKEAERRYESCESLKEDLTRYLHDETVLAGPPSALYRIRKYAKRKSGLLKSVAAVFSILLIAGIIITSITLDVSKSQERIRQVREALILLKQGDDVSFDEDKIKRDIETISIKQPDVAVVLYDDWGGKLTKEERRRGRNDKEMRLQLYIYNKINDLHETSWPNELSKEKHIDVFIQALRELNYYERNISRDKSEYNLYIETTDEFSLDQRVPRLAEALELAKEHKREEQLNEIRTEIGDDLLAGSGWASSMRGLLEVRSYDDFVWSEYRLKEFEEALSFYQDASAYWALTKNHKNILHCEGRVNMIHMFHGRHDKAIEGAKKVLAHAEEYYGKYDPLTIGALESLAVVKNMFLKDSADLIDILVEILERKTRAYGDISAEAISTLTWLGESHLTAGNYETGYAYLETALKNHMTNFGSNNAEAVLLETNLIFRIREEDITEQVVDRATEVFLKLRGSKILADIPDDFLHNFPLQLARFERILGNNERALDWALRVLDMLELLYKYNYSWVGRTGDILRKTYIEILINLSALERWKDITELLRKHKDDPTYDFITGVLDVDSIQIVTIQLDAHLKLKQLQTALDFADVEKRKWSGTESLRRRQVYLKIAQTFYDNGYKIDAIPFAELASDLELEKLNRLDKSSVIGAEHLPCIFYLKTILLETGQVEKSLDLLKVMISYLDNSDYETYIGMRTLAIQEAEDNKDFDYALELWREILSFQVIGEPELQLEKDAEAKGNFGLWLTKRGEYQRAINFLISAWQYYVDILLAEPVPWHSGRVVELGSALIQCFENTGDQDTADEMKKSLNLVRDLFN